MEQLILSNIHLLSMGFFGVSVAIFGYFGIELFQDTLIARRQEKDDDAGTMVSSMEVVSEEQFVFLVILGAMLGSSIGYLSLGNVMIMLVGGLIGVLVPVAAIELIKRQQLAKFDAQLIDALTTMSNSLKAGFSLIQALEMVSKEMSKPISSEFGLVIKENRLGIQLDKALTNLGKRVKSTNLDLVISSIVIVRQSGGNLPEVFDTIAATIRERIVMEGKVQSLTAQGRMQGFVLAVMPVFLLGAISAIQPDLTEALFNSTMGNAILATVAVLYILAGFMTYKIVNIDL